MLTHFSKLYFAHHFLCRVKVFDANTLQQLCEIAKENVIDFWLSPQGSYIAAWERPCKSFII